MFSPGMLTALAASIAVRSRGLPPGSPPPLRAATVISLITLVHDEARLASVMAFFRLICFHLLWPAMADLLARRMMRTFRLGAGRRNIEATPACGNAPTPLVSPLYDTIENGLRCSDRADLGLRIGTESNKRADSGAGVSHPAAPTPPPTRLPERERRRPPDHDAEWRRHRNRGGVLPGQPEQRKLAARERCEERRRLNCALC